MLTTLRRQHMLTLRLPRSWAGIARPPPTWAGASPVAGTAASAHRSPFARAASIPRSGPLTPGRPPWVPPAQGQV